MAGDQDTNHCCSSVNAQHGFSLLECVLYGAIMAFLSILLFRFFNNTTASLRLMSDREHSAVSLWSVHQLLCKDIQMAYAKSDTWQSDLQRMICRTPHECIGWELRKESLYRIKGDYDFNAQNWKHKSSALVASKIKYFTVALDSHEMMVRAVRYEIQTAHDKQKRTIMLENRRLN